MMKEQLKYSETSASRLKDEYREFQYHMAHDLAAIFRHISVFSEEVIQILSKQLEPEHKTMMKYVKMINASGKKGSAIITILQDYCDIDHQPLQYEAIDLNSLVTQVTTQLPRSETLKHANIIYDNLPTIVSDRRLLSRIFLEILKNSVGFCDQNENCKIRIDVTSYSDKWKFEIQDNGQGLINGSEAQIFKILTCAHNDSDKKGLGMGLAFVKKNIDLLGGDIHVQPNTPQGLKTIFNLPKTTINS